MDYDDRHLLRKYAEARSQEAFRELVERHIAMVYAAACRTTRDTHLAEDVAQRVFATLAQKAAQLKAAQTVGGWLYNTTRYLAMRTTRAEQRRREREQAAAQMISQDAPENISRVLDDIEPAMAELEEEDRAVLVLRYFEDRSLRSVGQELDISEDAARMRVNRALERLRTVFTQQGISVSSALLATMLASTITPVPMGLAASVTAAAITTATQVTFMTITWFNLKTAAAIIGAAAIAGTGTYWLQQRHISLLQTERAVLTAHQEQLKAELESAHHLGQAQKEELARLQKDAADVFRLRDEVTQLRRLGTTHSQPAQPSRPPNAISTQPVINPGRFISRDELVFVGRATPEEALQSMTWAAVKGTYEETVASFSPELQQRMADPKIREAMEQDRVASQKSLQGMQILARKSLGEDTVELKVKLEQDVTTGESGRRLPDLSIVKMIKVGDDWKYSQIGRDVQEWDQSDGVQLLAQ